MLTLKILFWACLLIVFYTYIGYGMLLYIIIRLKRLLTGKPRETVMPSDEELPTMTLMICAYNEEDVVAEKMANTLALDYPKDKFRIMWVTDGSNDRTNELLAAYPEVDIVFSPERKGKTAALKHGLREPEDTLCGLYRRQYDDQQDSPARDSPPVHGPHRGLCIR